MGFGTFMGLIWENYNGYDKFLVKNREFLNNLKRNFKILIGPSKFM